jgi:hypothetical protein
VGEPGCQAYVHFGGAPLVAVSAALCRALMPQFWRGGNSPLAKQPPMF